MPQNPVLSIPGADRARTGLLNRQIIPPRPRQNAPESRAEHSWGGRGGVLNHSTSSNPSSPNPYTPKHIVPWAALVLPGRACRAFRMHSYIAMPKLKPFDFWLVHRRTKVDTI